MPESEQTIALFERGVRLSETCRRYLEEAETRVEILTRKNETLTAEPFRAVEKP
jgi:exodeoxyribonuclease VII small subunit